MAARPSYGEAELHRSVGELDGKVEMLLEQQRRLLDKVDDVGERVSDVESKIAPIPGIIASHSSRIVKLELFDGKIAAVVMLISVTATTIGAGVWALIVNFSAVMAFAKRLFSGG